MVNKARQTGSIIIGTILIVLSLSVLGLSLQQFLRGQVRNQYGLMGDGTAPYNMPVDDAYVEAQQMAEFGLNWAIWYANHTNTAPGTAPVTFPTVGPSPTPDPASAPGYADPDRNIYPEPPTAPVATPSTANYWKSYEIFAPAANTLKVVGKAYIKGDTAAPPGKFVTRTVFAEWAGGGGSMFYLKKSTWKEDQ